jgi:hypothetical protein
MQLTKNLICLTLAVAGMAVAQQDPPGRVGRLGYMTGSVSLEPGGVDDWVPADPNRPLITGDRLWLDQGSRAEMHIGGSAIRLNAATSFGILNLDDQSVQLQLTQGSIEIHLRYLGDNQTFEVDTPNIAFSLLRPGIYRVDANPDNQMTFATVRSGQGEATGGGQAFEVLPSEQAQVSGDQQISVNVVGAPGPDWFDTWGDGRDRQEDQSVSGRYCSREMVGYQDLDGAGTWRSAPDYGQVWYPNAMPAGWAPYRNGHWAWIQPWGWTWVDDMAWGFAPFHYGRWAVIGGSWGWVPGPMAVRPVYAPALVAFVGGSGFSLSIGGAAGMAWFPLGPHEVYVPSYQVSPAYVNRVNVSNTVVNNVTITNVYNNVNVTNIRYVNQSAPGAVTAVSRETFVNARPVAHAVVEVRPEMLAKAQVVRTAAVAPTQAAVLGHATMASAPRPPAAALNRMVVTKATPPPPPVAFAKQQQLLQQNPGRPLEVKQVQQIRAQSPAPARPAFRPAPVAKSVTPAPKNPPPAAPHPATAPKQSVSIEEAKPHVQAPAQPPRQVEATRPVEQPKVQPRPQERPVPTPEVAKPAERPVEKPAERPAVKPVPTPPAERPVERPATQPAEHPMVKPAQPPAEHPLIKPAQPPPPAKPKPENKDEKKKEDEKKKQDEKKQ